ncbi:hypothetical protein HPB49_016240 [Dermacentor silvarum]|uniref:Uncharacterized protein n=1 Tax=Dermacentor silvarum TaxID=543639 RepID=A0ACB8DEW8_DERSI|nr:hypothetical protein HPB49_016240 [Dermacentor silvarum]
MRHTDTRRHYGRARLRDRQIPMEVYNDAELSWQYRFSKQAVLRLLEMLPLVPKDNERGHPVPPLLQLLIALRFYGAGTFQVVTGDLVTVSQSTVSRIIARMSRMIADTLFPQLVKFPNANDLASVMQEFYTIARSRFRLTDTCSVRFLVLDHAAMARNELRQHCAFFFGKVCFLFFSIVRVG